MLEIIIFGGGCCVDVQIHLVKKIILWVIVIRINAGLNNFVTFLIDSIYVVVVVLNTVVIFIFIVFVAAIIDAVIIVIIIVGIVANFAAF